MHYLLKCQCGNEFPGDLSCCPKCKATQKCATAAYINPRDYVYDIEVLPNIFTITIVHAATDTWWKFEISDRIDQFTDLINFFSSLKNIDARLIGFNNLGYDYLVIHSIIDHIATNFQQIYTRSKTIIDTSYNEKYKLMIWDNQRFIKQIDLFKIHHFDNKNVSTSLKQLEYCMRMDTIEEFTIPFDTVLTNDQKDMLLSYNKHDVRATVYFYIRSLPKIKYREELSIKYNRNFINHNDTKIGKDYFVMKLEQSGVRCYEKVNGGRRPVQTIRPSVSFSELIFPYINFERSEFQSLKQKLLDTTIVKTKGEIKFKTHVDEFEYVVGTGGIHASVSNKTFETTDMYQIVDVDVASFYPNLAIKNKLYPKHLSTVFCEIYEDVYKQRQSYAKGTSENATLKLALNGTYGDSNSIHSPFYDPFYTMSITINGQLLQLLLVEQLLKIPGLQMIQCNTDGITYYCPKQYMSHQRDVCKWWENYTLLSLEENLYNRMLVRDVNSYIAVKEDGKVKRIGAYRYETAEENPTTLEKPYSGKWQHLVVPKAAEAALIRGIDIGDFIRSHDDDYDFMMMTKLNKASKLVMRYTGFDCDIPMQRVSRYCVTKSGGEMIKISPPTAPIGSWKRAVKLTDDYFNMVMTEIRNKPTPQGVEVDSLGTPWDERIHTKSKSKHKIREASIDAGWKATDCNDMKSFSRANINYDFYIHQAKKLVNILRD